MILNQATAEAVYSAMCALNNVGGKLNADVPGVHPGHSVNVLETHRGVLIRHMSGGACRNLERHTNQAAFAAAYNLN